MQNPILGIGIANANIYTQLYYGHDHYLHNNFVELLACGGALGFLIYYSLYFRLLFCFYKNRNNRDREFDLCVVLLLIMLIVDFGAVSYYNLERYFMLYIIWLKMKKIRSNTKQRRYDMVEEAM